MQLAKPEWFDKWTITVDEPDDKYGSLIRLKEDAPQNIRDEFERIMNAFTEDIDDEFGDRIDSLDKYTTFVDDGFNLDLDQIVNDLASGDHKIDFTRIVQDSFCGNSLLYDLSTFTCCGESVKWIPSKHIAYIAMIVIDTFKKEMYQIYKDNAQYHDIKNIMLKQEEFTSNESNRLQKFLNENKQFNWNGDLLYCGATLHNMIHIGSKIKFNKEVLKLTHSDDVISDFMNNLPHKIKQNKAIFRIDKLNSPAIVNIFNFIQMEVICVGDVTFKVVDIDDEDIDDAIVCIVEEV